MTTIHRFDRSLIQYKQKHFKGKLVTWKALKKLEYKFLSSKT